MAHWLLKTEPDEYSWDDLTKRGANGDAWTGVRNFTARRHLKEIASGEKVTGDTTTLEDFSVLAKLAAPEE